ncbi:MAG TPA: NifU family protein [Myxococcaceae bacterium]|nr:NifU family protein [Myxococcaceae bacterium]
MPTHPTDTANPADLLERVQALTERVDELPDPQARQLAQELVAGVIAMYGDGLARIMEVIAGSREAGASIIDQLAHDGVVASLLLIHDLYPVSLEERVLEALDTVRPYMESHGGNVELVELRDGVARLALQGSCNGCAASRATLETAIEQALDEHAPDLARLEVEGVTERTTGFSLPMAEAPPTPAVELPVLQAPPPPRWVDVSEAARPTPGRLSEVRIGAETLVIADVDGSLLAYVDECASCGATLGAGQLAGGLLRCPSCEVEFDLPRAGRAAGGEPLQLRPVPLLQDGGLRVAL